jgi:hypothetical protein
MPECSEMECLRRHILRAVDELFRDTLGGGETWNALAMPYDKRQVMDLPFTVGQYNVLAMFLNSAGVRLDEGVPRFPVES